MPYTILVIDSSEKHRKVLRNFIEKAYPGVDLVEHDPSKSGMLADDSDWSQYQLVILDNLLGPEDGLFWYKTVKQQPKFPPVIFVSSMSDPGKAEATQAVIEAVRLGAENFLFKKGIVAKQLNSSITSVMKRVGYDPDETYRELEMQAQQKQQRIDHNKTLDTGSREIDLKMNDTVLEMELAMAMLHGYAEWPFSMRDILSGKAKVGKYQVTSYLGKTGHISTFRARSLEDNSVVIIKMISQLVDGQSQGFQKTMRNLEASIKWRHPGLVHYLDHMMVDGRLVIVQECLEGGKLSQTLATKGVTEEQAVNYVLQLLSGLVHLHQYDIVVAEMSPDTLIFRDPDTLVMTNIGIINRLADAGDTTRDAAVTPQTLFYTTPEQAQGRQVDHRSDIYIVGIILFEMLAGQPPFHRGSIQDILYAHATQPVPDLPGKQNPLNQVTQMMLKKTPAQRFQSAQAVIDVIKKIYQMK